MAAIFSAFVIAVNVIVVVIFLSTSRGGFDRVPAHYVVTLKLAQSSGPNGSAAASPATLPSRVVRHEPVEIIIPILKYRADPDGTCFLHWRAMDDDHVEVSMPAGSPEALRAAEEYERACRDAQSRDIPKNRMQELLKAPPDQRAGLLKSGGLTDPQVQNLTELAAAYDAWQSVLKRVPDLEVRVRMAIREAAQTTQPSQDPMVRTAKAELKKAQDNGDDLEMHFRGLENKIEASRMRLLLVDSVLAGFVPPEEAETMARTNPDALRHQQRAYQEGLAQLHDLYSGRDAELDAIVGKYEIWASCRSDMDGPSDLMRRLRPGGVLEFRMAPYDSSAAEATAYQMTPDEADSYKSELRREGPENGYERNAPFLWFPLHDPGEKLSGLITAQQGGRKYVLLSNAPRDTLLRPTPEKLWMLAAAYPTVDDMSKPAVGFRFDASGSALFGKLTDAHKRKPGARQGDIMAVLLDGEVYSAPNIVSKISDSGIITGSFTRREVLDLVRTFWAMSPLSASIKPELVSAQLVPESPAPGGAMRWIGLIALAVVAVFGCVLSLVAAVRGRAGGYLLLGLISTAAAAAFWLVTCQTLFTGRAPATAIWINMGLAGLTLLAGVISRTRLGYCSTQVPPMILDAPGADV